jgi:uncharacterized protein (TIGR02145 family)
MTGIFNPSVAGEGSHVITYTYSDIHGCINSAFKTLTVYALPVVQLTEQPSVCISVQPFALTGGTPATGGFYSGPGVNSMTGIFSPSVAGQGGHLITYSYTDVHGCVNSASKTLMVYSLPMVLLTEQPSVCLSVQPFALTGGSPSGTGGIYSGPGVNSVTGIFSPAFAGQGGHLITYTYTDQQGCTNSSAKTLTVFPIPDVQLSDQPSVCISAQPVALSGGSPAGPGGVYSGNGVNQTTGLFDPSAAGSGDHLITYTYTTPEGCLSAASKNIHVIPMPLPTGTISGSDPICQNVQNIPYNLSGTDPLATSFNWEIDPVTAGSFSTTATTSLLSLNAGFSGIIGIRFRPVSNCGIGAVSAYKNITVNPSPDVALPACNDPVTTRGSKPFLLKGGTPPDGVYAIDGTPLPDRILDPATLSPSPPDHTITYTSTNRFNCTVTKSQPLRVKNASGFICKNMLTDVRDMNTYPTFAVVTGAERRCWMGSDLKYGTYIQNNLPQTDNCQVEKYCAGNTLAKCDESGGLYQWDELMTYLPVDNASAEGRQGLCPPEWHVATESEWMQLLNYYMGPSLAGWNLSDPNPPYGFHANMQGVLYQNSAWAFLPPGFSASIYWTSTVNLSESSKIFTHGINDINPSVSKYISSRNNAFSIRCVRD